MTASSWVGSVARFVGDAVNAIGGGYDEADEDEQERLRRTVWKLERAYTKAAEGGDLGDLTTVVARTVRDGREALLAWLDLLEDIVQLTEARFGKKSGNGEFKATQAKAAVRRLLERSDARSAHVVKMLGPDAVDIATGWFIDVTVALLNNHDSLWQSGEASRSLRIPLRTRFLTALIRMLSRPLSWFRERTPLDPELYAAVERIASGPGSPLLVVDRVIDLGAWVVQHREQTLALVDLVSAACDEVEYFQNLHGGENKRAYARNLVLVALNTAGLDRSSPVYTLAGVSTNLLIDFIVATNNKRGRYVHRG